MKCYNFKLVVFCWRCYLQGDELQSIDGLLQSLGLGKYSILFKAEEVC